MAFLCPSLLNYSTDKWSKNGVEAQKCRMTTKTFIHNIKFQICLHWRSPAKFSKAKILTSDPPPPWPLNVIYVVMAMVQIFKLQQAYWLAMMIEQLYLKEFLFCAACRCCLCELSSPAHFLPPALSCTLHVVATGCSLIPRCASRTASGGVWPDAGKT